MRLPSLFKTPKYQRFNVTPRYYDPVKEEIDARTAHIRSIIDADQGELDEKDFPKSRIAGSFTTRKPTRKNVNMTQPVIILLLTAGLVGYWFYGNIALYIFLLVSSVLLYLKVKRII
ncbi:hypothetical protein [Fulvivirga sediminis]|uniref:Uncharacterized protein n=1 Tax=Fulvivirga sediminis TaxID=2803949 RepID=A0A937F7A3_9BACT|nr:hypothetical protein [Fulvivirga sediminis]MBL3656326.1 hypothetical protein [Fulvivirga sediminis]